MNLHDFNSPNVEYKFKLYVNPPPAFYIVEFWYFFEVTAEITTFVFSMNLFSQS